MAANFLIRVVQKKQDKLYLDIYIIHPEQHEFYEKKNFALQLIWQPAHPAFKKEFPINIEIDSENIFDLDWVLNNEYRFIKSVRILTTENYPLSKQPDSSDKDEIEEFWDNEKNLPKAAYEITVTNEKYILHIQKGMEWTSSAYDMEKYW